MFGHIVRGHAIQNVVGRGAFINEHSFESGGHGYGHLNIQGHLIIPDASAAIVAVQQNRAHRHIGQTRQGLVRRDVTLIKARIEFQQSDRLAGARLRHPGNIGRAKIVAQITSVGTGTREIRPGLGRCQWLQTGTREHKIIQAADRQQGHWQSHGRLAIGRKKGP